MTGEGTSQSRGAEHVGNAGNLQAPLSMIGFDHQEVLFHPTGLDFEGKDSFRPCFSLSVAQWNHWVSPTLGDSD